MSAVYVGPIFTGQADVTTNRACLEAQHAVSGETMRLVKTYGKIRFRYEKSRPTGHWEASIRGEVRGDIDVVTDSGIIYGHWLNGTGSRNDTTRFKGYFMWRKAFQDMERSGAMAVAQPILDRAAAEING